MSVTSFHFSCKHFDELTTRELYAIMRIRQEVFIVEQTCYYLDADDLDLNAWHVMGFTNEKMVAHARILLPGTSYETHGSIGRILTTEDVRGTGAGKALVEKSIAFYQKHVGTTPIKISAQCYLQRFYRSFGFVEYGDQYLEDGIPHVAMIKDDLT